MTIQAPAIPDPSDLVAADAVDPGVAINMSFLPFMDTLKEIVGGVLGGCVVILVGGLVLGAVAWAVSKLSGSGRMHQVSTTVMWVMLIAAIVAAGANGLIGWATGITII
ncbi:MAG: hypothetical protein LBK95_11595 [Bifidobacteriaceae bacterium]|jgi:hypothetical protein|nr:hypothetical protein [Bifidobacteriaceae bacterium]